MFTDQGSNQGFGGRDPAAWRPGTAGAESGGLHNIRGDEPLLPRRGARRAAASVAFFGARGEAEALQRGQGVGGQGGDGRAAAAAVPVVVFARVGARAAGVGGQQNQSAVVLRAVV